MQMQSTPEGAAVAAPVPEQKRRARDDLFAFVCTLLMRSRHG
jgi:hypothetical protein